MLQQTQVATAIPYYERWLARFPTVAALATAPLDDVLAAWQGLGYYARARNLHKAAQKIVAEHAGTFPTDFEAIQALPGVGRYTAGAVGSIALGLDVPLVDANVVRVLCRLFAIPGDPKSTPVQKQLWERAATELPAGEAGDFNQALMELGALVCQPAPRCDDCPVSARCQAYARGNPTGFPEFGPRRAFTRQVDVAVAIERAGKLLLCQRPTDGLWGGLWELPRVTLAPDESIGDGAVRAARTIAGVTITAGDVRATLKHGVTTRRITLHAVAGELAFGAVPSAVGCTAVAWADADERNRRYPMSSPQTRLIARLGAPQTQGVLSF
jgi:A/G-specific adenine glycosylase